jgi:extradiol dioxygenase family protein
MQSDAHVVFHLAIPSADLEMSADFYSQLGCRIARRYEDRVTVEFFGHQVVCHLSPDKIDRDPEVYPRHFGVTFLEEHQFDHVLAKAMEHGLPFFCEPFVRFKGLREVHRSFLLRDPSNNLLEFKYYHDPEMVY